MEDKALNTPINISLKRVSLLSLAWMLLMSIVVSIPHISAWVSTPFVLIGLVVLGLLWAINLKIPSTNILEYLLYAASLGLGYAIIGGLLMNWFLPFIGIMQPLARLPVLIFFDLSAIILSAGVYYVHTNEVLSWKPIVIDKINLFFGLFPIAFVILSVCGAERLNNGAGGILTLIMLFGIALYTLALLCYPLWSRVRSGRSIQSWVYLSALYLISLSLLLMYSLRSAHVFGWDINLEYQVFQTTLAHLLWKASYYPGLDYNACISITILPTIFTELTHLGSEYVFKVIYQLLFALTPVMVYALARRYVKETLSFLAAFLFLSQTWFFEQMPALIRQETAFVFYAATLLVLFDRNLLKWTRYILFYTFTTALILSHYSTGYVWITLMFGTIILSYGSRIFIRSLRGRPMVIKPMMFVISVLLLFIWEVPLTHTTGQITNFASNAATQAPAISASVAVRNSPSSAMTTPPSVIQSTVTNTITTALFANTASTTDNDISLAQAQAIHQHPLSTANVYDDASVSGYVPVSVTNNISLLSKFPYSISLLINLVARGSKILLIDVFPLIGILAMYLVFRRKKSGTTYDFLLVGIGCYVLIVLTIIIPYIQVYYNLTRLYLQMFMILSVLAAVGGAMIVSYLPKYRKLVLIILVVTLFCSLTGALDQITGGPARMTLDQPPANLDVTYTYDTEVASAQWLGLNRDSTDPVQADLAANLHIEAFGDISSTNLAIFPQTLERNSYVYLSQENVLTNKAFYGYENNLLMYNYPTDFLNSHKNLIYNNGGSEVYR